MKKRSWALLILAATILIFTSGCNSNKGVKLDPKNPVTVTMWHNYGGQMQSTMDELVDEFNATIGKEKGIIISVTSISAFKDIEEKLQMIASGDPGAPEMPNITVAYPKTAMFLNEQGLLATLDEQFTQEELSAYLPQFIEEGRLPDGKLYVFPIAKSTEVLFVNKTLFDRFSADTGVSINILSTFEGIAEAAIEYAKWSDEKTLDIDNDPQKFYTADSWFNIAQIGVEQMGDIFIEPDHLRTDTEAFRRVWDVLLTPALEGGYAATDGYSSDLSKVGEIICSTGSTAGILFYGDSVTYPDNTIEPVEYVILPYPIFEGGEKIALQRGAGMSVAKSTPEKEYAASLFLSWVTQPVQNMRFVSSTGYLPVTKEAFEKNLTEEISSMEDPNVRKMLEAATQMYQEYSFIVAPNYQEFDAMSKNYETAIKQAMRYGREQVLSGVSIDAIKEDLFLSFMK